MDKPKLLVISDFAVDTGFAQVAHNIVDRIADKYDVYVLAINYYGDAHPYQRKYNLYNPSTGGDVYGYGRIDDLIKGVKPNLIFMINDPWIVEPYLQASDKAKVPSVVYTPIDSRNVDKKFVLPLNKATHVVSYTHFGEAELRAGGLTTELSVIPHGVDTSMYFPVDKSEARKQLHLTDDMYIVNVTDRNSPRKRLDLAIQYFSEWVHTTNKPKNVKLYIHCSLNDLGWDILQLADYFEVGDRMIMTSPDITPAKGVRQDAMRVIYSAADVGMSTTMAEGWGLTTAERMACRVPMIVPEYSALAEWPRGGVEYVPTSGIYVSTNRLNTIQAIADKFEYIETLEFMYNNPEYRAELAQKGYDLITQDKFKWDIIASQFDTVFGKAMSDASN